GFLLGDKSMKWWTIGLSVMATQASAITFLSTPGQAYESGMGFVQFYFGLPIAMVILSITVVPIYYRLKVYTAYEFLENRFDLKTRTLAAFLFLVQRGLAAGITIYAPAIILSSILGWSLIYTNLLIGVLVIIYTVSGGTKAVSQTQKYQMVVMMGGMIFAGIVILNMLPQEISFNKAMHVAGKMGKLNLIDWEFDYSNRYNIWSGITGGLFLFLSYFGTDQSQVQRYLTGSSIRESRLGLIFNGLLKIPMQFIILLIGVLVFVFYQFYQPPLFFNKAAQDKVYSSELNDPYNNLEQQHDALFARKKAQIEQMLAAIESGDQDRVEQLQQEVNLTMAQVEGLREQVVEMINEVDPELETQDTDYVFISFIMKYLPHGMIGLLLAVIFSAAMSSTAGELNALASTTTVDIYKRSVKKSGSDRHYLISSKLFTLMWGLIAITFAAFASLLDNLIEAVNIIGSLFYGTILGIFLVAFYLKRIRGNAVFIAALVAEGIVMLAFYLTEQGILTIGYLWYNVIGCILVIIISYLLQWINGMFVNKS
ncbi:MAG: sodium:solute symporter family transporter, partial [Candidatus Cyclobacteriaceae bacterium M3_2C_046]